VIKDDLQSSAIRRYVNDMMRNPFNPNREPETISKILALISRGKTRLNNDQIDNIKKKARANAAQYLDECGILSFSLNPQNPLLWGHYAASFAGVCIVFQRDNSLNSIFSVCAKTTYVNSRPHLRLSELFDLGVRRITDQPYNDLADRIFFYSFLHKDCHWSHEEEARIFYPFDAFKKKHFHPNELVAIVAGPRSQPDTITRLIDEIKSRRPSVAFHHATLSDTEFKIIIPSCYLRR
jgi:hypothetical protein